MNYKPFTNDNTKEIIKEIKDSLPNINKSILSIDTLDLCHLLGEIERLNNIIKEVRKKIENTTINCEGVAEDLIDDIYEIIDKENK